jgi:hypothetical protein
MPGFGDYGFVEWKPLRRVAPAAVAPAVREAPIASETLGVLLRALMPFREARQAVVRALREAEGLPPTEALWTG